MRTIKVRRYVDKALDLLQRHSMESAKADWPAIRAQAHLATVGASTPEDTYDAIRHVIATLGNPHTHLITSHRAGTPSEPTVPTGRLVETTAWLVIPETDSRNGEAYVRAGLSVLTELIASRPTGWVVDLRGNRGGDMHPMLTVVAPLLGEGEKGRFIRPQGRPHAWGIRRGHVYNGRHTAFRKIKVPAALDTRVAVLVDGHTASSGEAVLISFLGAENVRTFGEPTAGYATANQAFKLPDGARLAITTAHMADRTGRVHGNTPIAPDTPVSNSSATGDRVRDAAIAWLEQER
ncbi:S41 family peptidase [Lentzea sp. NPDC006480]|uniref:S41 family peptidase n=1 Tax=Lentzea sp. NPDC006480 TaxID=3157176 RepID=UPI0033B696DC